MNCRRFLALLAGLPALGLGLAHAQQETPSQLMRRAVDAFFAANMRESVELFDQLLKLEPALKPELWQRGLALYLAGDYQAGRDQFEVHQGFNSHDVENAVWHFLCVARLDGVDKARQALIPIEGDSRVPMREVYELFAGRGSVKAVLEAAVQGVSGTPTQRNQLCYAHLYLGLYHEAIGEQAKAREHMLKAAQDYRMEHYMGRCAEVHVRLRGWDKPSQVEGKAAAKPVEVKP
jgi:lipoprotein NlpI